MLGDSKSTRWRTEKYKKGIKEGDFESLLKFLRQRIKYQPTGEVLDEAEELNSKLFKVFVERFLREAAADVVAFGKPKKPFGLPSEVLEEVLRRGFERDFRAEVVRVEREFEEKAKELEPYYFYSLYEARELLGERLFEYLRRNGFDFLSGERYYVEEAENLKGCLESVKGVLESFEQELKEELLLAKSVLSEKQYEKLLLEVKKLLKKLQITLN
jgi:hypothetical protein